MTMDPTNSAPPASHTPPPSTRVLVVMPSWVGDAVMATPALQLLRAHAKGCFIGGLLRPGLDGLLAGLDVFDEVHTGRTGGMMGPKRLAAKVRGRRYETALLLTNSFSTALAVRMAHIPRRIGYDRDGRGVLLTDRLPAPKRQDTPPFDASPTNPGAWAPVPACAYYHAVIARFLRTLGVREALLDPARLPALRLAVTERDDAEAARVFASADVDPNALPMGLLNPGGNNPAKRWPAERFAALAQHLARAHGMTILINGSPAEAELAREIASRASDAARCVVLPDHGITLDALKAVVQRCRLVVTNDTGPRHIAAAVGTPIVTLFGPTDHRWTTIPFDREVEVLADPTLPASEVANDHPQRCAVERITLARVIEACETLLSSADASAAAG